MKTNFMAAVLASSIAVVASGISTEASAQYLQKAFIYHNDSGKCADFAAFNTSNSVTMQLWSCGGNSATNQQWYLVPAGQYPGAASYLFQNVANWTCAAVEHDSLLNGAKIVQRTCDPNNPSQHWIHLANSAPGASKTRWMNGRSAKCLDVWNNGNGTVFQQYTCAGNSNWGPQGFETHFVPFGS